MAARLRALAEASNAQCAGAQRQMDGVVWVSAAASTFRQQVAEDLALYGRIGANVLDVATALDHVAETLAERQRTLTTLAMHLGHSVEDLYHGALDAGQDVLSYASDIADGVKNEVGDVFGAAKNLVGSIL